MIPVEEVVKGKQNPLSPVVIEGGGTEIDDEEVARLKADDARKRKTELLRDNLLDLPTTLILL